MVATDMIRSPVCEFPCHLLYCLSRSYFSFSVLLYAFIWSIAYMAEGICGGDSSLLPRGSHGSKAAYKFGSKFLFPLSHLASPPSLK